MLQPRCSENKRPGEIPRVASRSTSLKDPRSSDVNKPCWPDVTILDPSLKCEIFRTGSVLLTDVIRRLGLGRCIVIRLAGSPSSIWSLFLPPDQRSYIEISLLALPAALFQPKLSGHRIGTCRYLAFRPTAHTSNMQVVLLHRLHDDINMADLHGVLRFTALDKALPER